MIWDPNDNKAKTFDDSTIKDYALEGAFDVGGVKVQPAFALLKAQVKQNTPEWQEPIASRFPAATVRRLSKELVDHAQIGRTITIDGVVSLQAGGHHRSPRRLQPLPGPVGLLDGHGDRRSSAPWTSLAATTATPPVGVLAPDADGNRSRADSWAWRAESLGNAACRML